MKNHIPILPIAVETNLEEFFAVEMNRIGKGYGDIQILNLQITDKTAIQYRQKLYNALEAALVDNEEIERIKQAFSKHIFLSYRKKDRKYAKELLQSIYDIPFLQNVSVWYDEFISSGEKWSSQIEDALKNSEVFLLLVTPSIIEAGNYVIRKEYPMAKRQKKKIIPVSKLENQNSPPSLKELEYFFPGIKCLVNGDKLAELEEALRDLKNNVEINSEKKYLIGLAFFNGIGTDRNIEKAVSLIVDSAQDGLPEAINKLADMYWTGDGIAINYEYSIIWRKKLIEIYDDLCTGMKNHKDVLNNIKAQEKLIMCLYELSKFRESLLFGKRLVTFIDENTSILNQTEIFAHYSKAYDFCGKNCIRLGLYDEAINYNRKYCDCCKKKYEEETTIVNFHNLAVGYERLGEAYYSKGNMEQAEILYEQALEIDAKIDEELQSVDSAYSLSVKYLRIGDIHVRKRSREYEKSNQYYEKAVELRKKILDAEDTKKWRKEYEEAILAWGDSFLLKGDNAEAKRLFWLAKEIMEDYIKSCETIEAQYAYTVVLNRCAKICEMEGNYNGALTYYNDSLNCRKKIMMQIGTNLTVYQYALTLYFKAGVYAQLYDNESERKAYGEVVDSLIPILSKDCKGDWHYIFAKAAFECFKADTFAGRHYLQYAIDAWKWLTENKLNNDEFQKQYDVCMKVYQRCYRQ